MVRARDVNKDIRAIAKKTQTAVFSYDDIHNSSVNNEFHYDYNRVIDEVSKLQGWNREEAIKQLERRGILSPLPNGEYKVEVGTSTKEGGGLNYHGVAFFTMTSEDYQVKYHELAHSLQKEYSLFDNEKIDKLYRISAKGLTEEQAKDKQINKTDYEHYLKEMHSESFSYAAMMLRAENPLDFARQVYIAYNEARMRNSEGFFSFGKTEYGADSRNSAKFYSTFPVMRETIRTIMKIRKQGKTKDFFDENGVLKDEKLAKLCEQVILKSAYSPRTLKSYFNYNMLDGHNDNEHGWRRDTFRGIASTIHGGVIMLASEKNLFGRIKSRAKHDRMEKEEKKKIAQQAVSERHFDDPETQALHDYIVFYNRCIQLGTQFHSKFANASTYSALTFSVLRAINPVIHEASIRNRARGLMYNESVSKQEKLGDEMVKMAYWMKNQRDNPYFCHLVQEKTSISDVIKMYREKLEHPEKTQIENPVPINKYKTIENRYGALYSVNHYMYDIQNLANDYKLSDAVQKSLINLSIQDVRVIDDPKIRDNIANAVNFGFDPLGRKKRKFKKDLNKTLDCLSADKFDGHRNLSIQPVYEEIQGKTVEEIITYTREEQKKLRPTSEKHEPTSEKYEQTGENRELAENMVRNNLDAMNYLADRYGLSDRLRMQLQKMAVLPQDKLENKQLRKTLVDIVHFDGDWFGSEKRQFKKDLDKLMDSFVDDRVFQKDNPAYAAVCQETAERLKRNKELNATEDHMTNSEVVQEAPANRPSEASMEETVAHGIFKEKTENPVIFGIQYPPDISNNKVNPNSVAYIEETREVVEKPKTPKEIVIEKLKSWGVEEGSYMIITPEDNLYTRYDGANGPEARSVNTYFEAGVEDIQKNSAEIVYGKNNGLVGAYFAEGVYVVSSNTALRDALYYKGKDVGFGVMLSNGEPFVHADTSRDNTTNADWSIIKRKGDKISDERAEAYEARQKMMEEKNNATAADIVSKTLSCLCEFGDKYDAGGQLKETLAKTYLSEPDKMTGVEFWGNIVQQLSDKAPEGRDKLVLEVSQLGSDITKEIKANAKNRPYEAVKARCAEAQNSDEMLKISQACSARSHNNAAQYRDAAHRS